MPAAAEFFGNLRDIDIALRTEADPIFVFADLAHVNDRKDLARCERNVHEAVVIAVDRSRDWARE